MTSLSKSEKKILFGLLSILLVLATVTYLYRHNSQRIIAGAEEMNRAQEIKYHLEKIIQVTSDIESGMRGFVISGDALYLEPSNKAVSTVFIHFGQLRNAAISDAILLKNINSLEQLVDKKITTSNNAIELRRQKGAETASAYIAAGEGLKLMNSIRELTGRIQKEQDEILSRGQKDNKSNIRNYNTSFDLLLIKITILAIAVFLVLRYTFNSRRKSDRVLAENREMLEAIMDNTSSLICIKDLAGRYVHLNRQYENLFHRSEEQVKGKTDHDLMPKALADAIRHSDLEVIRNKRHMEFEEDFSHSGMIRHYLSVRFPLFDRHHVVHAVCSVSTDITERKQSEQLLKERSDSILDLFNNAPCGYHTINKEGIVIEINDTELKWLGYSRDEVVGIMKIGDMLSEESKLIFDYHFLKLINKTTEHIHDLEIRMKRKDGSLIAVLLNVAGIYDEYGEFIRTRSSVFDITLRKQAEAIYSQN